MAISGSIALGVATYSSIAISIASTVASYAKANKDAKAIEAAQETANETSVKNSITSFQGLDAAQADVLRTSLEQSVQNQVQVAKAKGEATAVTGATGAGNINAMIQDINRTGGENTSNIIENRQQSMNALRANVESIRQGGIASQRLSPISKPSWVTAGLQLGSQALQGYNAYKEADKLSQPAIAPRDSSRDFSRIGTSYGQVGGV